MTEAAHRARLREFLSGAVGGELSDEDDIFDLGYVNSLFALELVSFVEREFTIVVENEDLELDNFRSVAAMASLVARKAAVAPGGATATR